MNKFEDHWRKKTDDPEAYKDFLKEKFRAEMWEKILASKNGFEQNWQTKAADPGAWEGILTETDKQALWEKLQTSLVPFEQQWREKIDEASQADAIFLDEAAKGRIAATVFAGKENFELDWQDKMDDPVQIRDTLNTVSKDRIWHNLQSGNVDKTGSVPKEKRRPFFFLRWSHAAALLIGALSTWLIWERSGTPLQNTLVITPRSEVIAPAVKPVAATKEIIPAAQQQAVGAAQDALSKPVAKQIAKPKAITPAKESRGVVERFSGKATPVKALQSAVVSANATPVINTNKTTVSEEKANLVTGEPEIEVAINKSAPVKKVVHISDIRPAAAPAKGTAIYGRAFGDGKGKRNEKSTMTFNSVLKNYK